MAFDLTGKAVKHLRLPTVEYRGTVVKLVPAQTGDINSRFFRVTLYDDRGDIPLDSYSSVVLFVTLPDGTKQKCNGEFDAAHEYAICKLESSMLAQVGKVSCDIRLYGNDKNNIGTSLTSQTFYVLVSQSQSAGDSEDGSGELFVTVSPSIGENGNWFVDGVDTGISAAGIDGKSAYETAQEGGYEGTAEEFAAMLANGLPQTTAEDNGKFLRVVDGVAVWSDIAKAEEVAF